MRALLTAEDDVRPELRPLLAWWEGADRPDRVRRWLARRPAARAILRALAEGTVPATHQGLDQLDDTNTVRYLRRVLVAAGVLPAHDEHLNRLQRWLHRTLADICDPQQRRIVHRYAHWHQLRRRRTRTGPHTPVTTGQAATVREHVNAAAAVLATLATAHRSLADLRQADVDQWLATAQVARRAELGAFLRWTHQERLTTVALPVLQWTGPRDRVDHEQRWAQARRLLHDDTLPTEARIAGLLVVLYAQTATNIRTLRFDQVHTTPNGARITFGTTPIDLPPTLATNSPSNSPPPCSPAASASTSAAPSPGSGPPPARGARTPPAPPLTANPPQTINPLAVSGLQPCTGQRLLAHLILQLRQPL
ncbi:hypothetical protein K1W54_18655 [Micromonospora sp. CPCC 205371]|nr:hypothetical protein [Micromonospora sp. CPCC 205371]